MRIFVSGLAVVALAAGIALGPQGARESRADTLATVLQIAEPLGQQFGVPVASLRPLLEQGVSLESVAQLLLVKQDAGADFADVREKYEQTRDVAAVASDLGVEAEAYGEEKVDDVLADARKSAVDEAAGEAAGAIGGMLGR